MTANIRLAFLVLFFVLLVSACTAPSMRYSGGEVPRGTYQVNYSALLLDFYRNDPRMHQAASAEPMTVKVPARLAVAQLGELQAASNFLTELRGSPELLASVASVPAVPPDLAGFYQYTEQSVSLGGTERRHAPQQESKDPLTPKDFLQELRLMSLDLGSDYLLVYGGSIDFRTKEEAVLKLLDLTIVGAFIIPSEAHSLQGRAIGLLIDVKQNRIVLSTAADTTSRGLASSRYSESALRNLITDIRVELQKNLAKEFVKNFTARALQSRPQTLSKN
ncbi:MAG TPA: hypothetical protein VL754_03210 [Verrucomicrobiae bacterium]|jgi:hypothetical protein|nr:hypothetical protein [Verrucomicrobiae bacterium]